MFDRDPLLTQRDLRRGLPPSAIKFSADFMIAALWAFKLILGSNELRSTGVRCLRRGRASRLLVWVVGFDAESPFCECDRLLWPLSDAEGMGSGGVAELWRRRRPLLEDSCVGLD